ncbi:MAG: MurR/RpiR family transcriptional regulator [Lachnospiraceae bacterium]|nr:MurR/RpiR family transcriptional regulator [Lachnospiraceae bacterium]
MATSIDDEIFVKIRFLYPSLTKSEKKVADVILDDYEKVCSYTLAEYSEIAGCSDVVHADKINFFGVGDAWVACEAAHIKFQRIGVQSSAYSDVALALATASLMKEGDLAIGISFSGETKLVVDALRIAKENGAKTLCIVHYAKCELVKYADMKIFTATTDYTPGHDEIARRTAEFAIIDTLYMGLVSQKSEIIKEKSRKTLRAIIDNKN